MNDFTGYPSTNVWFVLQGGRRNASGICAKKSSMCCPLMSAMVTWAKKNVELYNPTYFILEPTSSFWTMVNKCLGWRNTDTRIMRHHLFETHVRFPKHVQLFFCHVGVFILLVKVPRSQNTLLGQKPGHNVLVSIPGIRMKWAEQTVCVEGSFFSSSFSLGKQLILEYITSSWLVRTRNHMSNMWIRSLQMEQITYRPIIFLSYALDIKNGVTSRSSPPEFSKHMITTTKVKSKTGCLPSWEWDQLLRHQAL